MRVERRSARRIVLVLRQQAFELTIFFRPLRVIPVKGLRDAAPADVSGEDFLLVRARLPALRFNLLERLDGGNVERILRLCAAFAQMVIRDAEVLRFVRLGFFALRFLPRQVDNEVVQPNLSGAGSLGASSVSTKFSDSAGIVSVCL